MVNDLRTRPDTPWIVILFVPGCAAHAQHVGGREIGEVVVVTSNPGLSLMVRSTRVRDGRHRPTFKRGSRRDKKHDARDESDQRRSRR
jgi:hypothetical protein